MTLERSGCALKCRSSRTLKAKSIFQFIFARTQNRSTLKCNFLFKRQFLAGATSFLSPILLERFLQTWKHVIMTFDSIININLSGTMSLKTYTFFQLLWSFPEQVSLTALRNLRIQLIFITSEFVKDLAVPQNFENCETWNLFPTILQCRKC